MSLCVWERRGDLIEFQAGSPPARIESFDDCLSLLTKPSSQGTSYLEHHIGKPTNTSGFAKDLNVSYNAIIITVSISLVTFVLWCMDLHHPTQRKSNVVISLFSSMTPPFYYWTRERNHKTQRHLHYKPHSHKPNPRVTTRSFGNLLPFYYSTSWSGP